MMTEIKRPYPFAVELAAALEEQAARLHRAVLRARRDAEEDGSNFWEIELEDREVGALLDCLDLATKAFRFYAAALESAAAATLKDPAPRR